MFTVKLKISPFVAVRDFIAANAAATFAFYLADALVETEFSDLFARLPVSRIISYDIAFILALLALQTIIIIGVFLRWAGSGCDVSPAELRCRKGLIFKTERAAPLAPPLSAEFAQSFLGKIAGYGTVTVSAADGTRFPLGYIADPQAAALAITRGPAPENAAYTPDADIGKLLASCEGETLEFKSSFRWNALANRTDKALEFAVFKTIAGFLNAGGGYLLIGVADDKKMAGLEAEFAALKRKDADGFESNFNQAFLACLGAEFRQLVRLRFFEREGRAGCLVAVNPAAKPAYLRFDNAEFFCLRTGNSTALLKMTEAASYITTRFQQKA